MTVTVKQIDPSQASKDQEVQGGHCRHHGLLGFERTIHDNGGEFTGKELKEMMDLLLSSPTTPLMFPEELTWRCALAWPGVVCVL